MKSYWRNMAAPIIRQVMAEVGTEDTKKLRRALNHAYPFHEKKLHPYRIWCDEVKRQLRGDQPRNIKKKQPVSPGQLLLMDASDD
jgi:hypothetical protein